jgi:hypothetical protein
MLGTSSVDAGADAVPRCRAQNRQVPTSPLRFSVRAWAGTGSTTVEIDGGALRPVDAAAADAVGTVPLLPGTLSAGLADRHVHLGLVDRGRLAGSAVVAVDDLGWLPGEAAAWRTRPPAGVAVRIAGPFLAPPRGYPSGRSWAPAGSVREVPDVAEAETVVAELTALGAGVAKVTLHAAFPDFAPGVLEALVEAAHAAGLRVVAHVEGPGRAERALDAEVDALAHVPWTERLPDRVVEGFAHRTTWISTLGLHRGLARRRALGNARRFVAAGGRLRYGTDMGNGPTPAGVNRREILALGRAGLAGAGLLAALVLESPGALRMDAAVWSGRPMPEDAEGVADWFASARRFRCEDLEEPR